MATYNDINTLIKAVESRPGLVMGFTVQGYDVEILFAVDTDGNVWTTGDIDRTDEFDTPQRAWSESENIPAHAEFIGYYPAVSS